MLFWKNLGETPWRRCGGISRDMANKSTTSEPATPVAETRAATVPESAVARKLYAIVKYGDPVLEKPAAVIGEDDACVGATGEEEFGTKDVRTGIGVCATGGG